VAGTRSISGQFDELETFNYQLPTNEISRSFELVQSMDTDLDGTPDLIEDIVLTKRKQAARLVCR
jgi:hypothetical protein